MPKTKNLSVEELSQIREWEDYAKAVKQYSKDLKEYLKSDVSVKSGNPPTPPPPPPR